jgi:hypothetical protein
LGININLLLEYLILKHLLSEKKERPISIMAVIKSSKKAS